MSNKIIFFDIDQTLFNSNGLMSSFFEELRAKYNFTDNQIQQVESVYEKSKNGTGCFSPSVFLKEINNQFPKLSNNLDYFFKSENIKKYIFDDSKILFDLKDIEVGIFSKGEYDYQKLKIHKFLNVINKDNLYIFVNKEEKIPEVFSKYLNKKVYLVDDNQNVLLKAKGYNKNIITVLIDRKKRNDKSDRIDFVIESLFDIIPVLNEKIT